MEIAFWHWWAFGFALFAAEMLLPTGFVLLFLGAAAMVTGGAAWLFDGLGWRGELAIFGLASLAGFFLWKRFRPVDAPLSDQPALNRRGASYVGRSFTLEEPIVNGVGKLRVDDSQWRIAGLDAPAGTQVRVTAADGSTLKVERAG